MICTNHTFLVTMWFLLCYQFEEYSSLGCNAVQPSTSSPTFGGKYCLLLQGQRLGRASNHQEASTAGLWKNTILTLTKEKWQPTSRPTVPGIIREATKIAIHRQFQLPGFTSSHPNLSLINHWTSLMQTGTVSKKNFSPLLFLFMWLPNLFPLLSTWFTLERRKSFHHIWLTFGCQNCFHHHLS